MSLFAAVAIRYGVVDGNSATRHEEAARTRLESLRRVVAARREIAQAYDQVSAAFARRVAAMKTYQTKDKIRGEQVAALVKDQLDHLGALQNLAVAPVTDSPSGDGMVRSTVSVTFVSANDEAAGAAIDLFARPETGLAWQSLSVAADRQAHRVSVTGKVVALAVDAIE